MKNDITGKTEILSATHSKILYSGILQRLGKKFYRISSSCLNNFHDVLESNGQWAPEDETVSKVLKNWNMKWETAFIYLYSAMFTCTSLKNLSSGFIMTQARTRCQKTPWWSEPPVSPVVTVSPSDRQNACDKTDRERSSRMNGKAEAIKASKSQAFFSPHQYAVNSINRKPKAVWPTVRTWEQQGCF